MGSDKVALARLWLEKRRESEPSAELRDRLIAELDDLAGADEAALWAHRCLPQKNRLTAADAQMSRRPLRRDWRALPLALQQNLRRQRKARSRPLSMARIELSQGKGREQKGWIKAP